MRTTVIGSLGAGGSNPGNHGNHGKKPRQNLHKGPLKPGHGLRGSSALRRAPSPATPTAAAPASHPTAATPTAAAPASLPTAATPTAAAAPASPPAAAGGNNMFLAFWMIIGSKIPFDLFLESLMVGVSSNPVIAKYMPLKRNVLLNESIKRAFMANVEKDGSACSMTRKYADGTVRICGLVFGKWYVCIIPYEPSSEGRTGAITVYSVGPIDHMFEKDNDDDDDDDAKPKPKAVQVYTPGSNRYDGYNMDTMTRVEDPTPAQQAILDDISRTMVPDEGCIDLIYGLPGTGKSRMAYMIAKLINPKKPVVVRYNPSAPGYGIHDVVNNLLSTGKGVILMDEGDSLFVDCFKGGKQAIVPHEHLNTQVTDKASLNALLDDIKHLYPNVHLVITSNRTPEQITKACGGDGSVTRPGRMNCHALLEDKKKKTRKSTRHDAGRPSSRPVPSSEPSVTPV
jgi:hypothetical protein